MGTASCRQPGMQGCSCDDGRGGAPAPNKTSAASHFFIGRDPQYLPYAGMWQVHQQSAVRPRFVGPFLTDCWDHSCPNNLSECNSCWDPVAQLEIGADFSTPKAGECKPGQALGDPLKGGCTWRASPVVDVIYGAVDLRPHSWQFAPGEGSHYPRFPDNTTVITLANIEVFKQAWVRHDTKVGKRCCGC